MENKSASFTGDSAEKSLPGKSRIIFSSVGISTSWLWLFAFSWKMLKIKGICDGRGCKLAKLLLFGK